MRRSAASTVKMRMSKGVDRPCLASIMPRGQRQMGHGGYRRQYGLQSDEIWPQFAVMAELYSKKLFGNPNPSIGLLSVGGEDIKGNELTKETFKILSRMPINFIGNVEGHDTFTGECGRCGLRRFRGKRPSENQRKVWRRPPSPWLKDAFTRNAVRKAGAILAKEAFSELKKHGDFEGIRRRSAHRFERSFALSDHGVSSPKAIKNANPGCQSVSHIRTFRNWSAAAFTNAGSRNPRLPHGYTQCSS